MTMTHGTADRVTFSFAAQTVLRVLVASYFMAVALQLIPGTDLSLLFSGFMPDIFSDAISAGLVFVFSFMIMVGTATRVAALMLSLMMFFASYVTMVQMGIVEELGGFWRDIALIAALLLTYNERDLGSPRRRRVLQRRIVPRRVNAILRRAAENPNATVTSDTERDVVIARMNAMIRDQHAQSRDKAEAAPSEGSGKASDWPRLVRYRRAAPPLPEIADNGDDTITNIFADDRLSA